MFKPYRYEKTSKYPTKKQSFVSANSDEFSQFRLLLRVSVSTICILFGVYLMISKVLIPAVVTYASSGDAQPVISPLADDNQLVLSVSHKEEVFTFDELKNGNLGFGKTHEKNAPDHFYLTIPKIDIYDALIEVNSENLDPKEALGHYKGSCLPDEACNTFIFGHSTYKWAKNKYEEGDYTAIFSKLEELENGDEFTITYNGEKYNYLVDLTRVAAPEEIDPLVSPYPRSLGKHESTVELFTCTPSGTTKYRLSVVGKLVE